MHVSEAKMQAEIFQYFWNNHPSTRRLIFHVPNGGSRTPIEAVQLRAQGVVKGVPDLIGLGVNGMFAVELKIPGGKLSAEQNQIHDLWRNKGYKVYVCWSYNEAVEVIGRELDI